MEGGGQARKGLPPGYRVDFQCRLNGVLRKSIGRLNYDPDPCD